MSDEKDNESSKGMNGTSRRTALKLIASAPLAITFGLVVSPLMRFLKPTMEPLNFLQKADMPQTNSPVVFDAEADFPVDWVCLPFTFVLTYVEFNPEKEVNRQIPCFIIRIPNNEIVAYSRICPKRGCI